MYLFRKIVFSFLMLLGALQPAMSNELKAALSLYFVPRGAFPVGDLNTAKVGDLLQLSRTGANLIHREQSCFPELRVQPFLRIEGTHMVEGFGVEFGFGISGAVLAEELAEISGGINLGYNTFGLLNIDPLSTSEAIGNLQLWNVDLNRNSCAPIARVLNGQPDGQIVVARLYHGSVTFEKRLELEGDVAAQAEIGELVKKLKLRLPINGLSVSASGNIVTLSKAATPGNRTLAVVPLNLSPDALAAISAYLDGARGASLENLVKEALRGAPPSRREQIIARIIEFLGGEFDCENYARRFFSSEFQISYEQLLEEYTDKINMQNIAVYMSAHDLTCGE